MTWPFGKLTDDLVDIRQGGRAEHSVPHPVSKAEEQIPTILIYP